MAVKRSNSTALTVITKEEKKKLKEIADKEDRSLSNLIAHIIRQYLEKKSNKSSVNLP